METDRSERCGLGIRGVAMTIDAVVWFGLLFVAGYAVAIPTGQVEVGASGLHADLEGTPGLVAFLLWLGLGIGYHTVLEWQTGKTLGKYLVGIRVTDDDGTPLTLRSSLVRNVARLVDWLPLCYGVGIGLLLVSDSAQRFGDRVGRTAVVRA